MSMLSNKEVEKVYERTGLRPRKGDDGKPVRIRVSHPSKSGQTVHVKADNFTDRYQGIDSIGRDMRVETLEREWKLVAAAKPAKK